jgi:aminomethyltransferase
MADLRHSPLADRHRGLDANLTAFAGWEMPLDYGSVVAEHRAVRAGCGVFDLSHLGTLVIRGAGAAGCLQQAFSNAVDALEAGRAQYTLCLDDDGGIVDDLLLYRLPWGYFAVPNAANAATVQAAVEACAGDDVEVADVKADLACIAVQGPESPRVLVEAGVDVGDLAYLECEVLAVTDPDDEPDSATVGPAHAGALPDGGVLARSGYTGERGYELFVPADRAPTLWDRLTAAGAVPAGLGARDTLRLEMGYPLHGNDITPATSPAEAGLGWACRGSGFRGEAAYRAAQSAGPERQLRGLRATGRGIPRRGCAVRSGAGAGVGEVTSGTFAPSLQLGVALAYLDAGIEDGEAVTIDVRGKAVPAEVVHPPFVDADPRR